MRKVITYGTYDLLHYGHIRLLERAKDLGDYLIVGITAEDFDKVRGKINVSQSLMERVEAVKATGIADEVIIEEYEGQKIDDIQRYGVDVFAIGSDWTGFFDYLKEYCEVVYLDRTQGVSSTDLRVEAGLQTVGFIGDNAVMLKYIDEMRFVNGMRAFAFVTSNDDVSEKAKEKGLIRCSSLEEMLVQVDSVYIASHPSLHEAHIETALNAGKHVLCESPITLSVESFDRLSLMASTRGLVLMDGLKTAYSTAYHRLKLLIKSGRIGDVVSVESTCTSLRNLSEADMRYEWNSFCAWGPTALLPVFQLLGTKDFDASIISKTIEGNADFDVFSSVLLAFKDSLGTVKIGKGVKSEGDLVISGTKGYVYVPAPWWKTDYFEVRFEDSSQNRRYFYQLNGEGIRYELVCFHRAIEQGEREVYVEEDTSRAIISVAECFFAGDRVDLVPVVVRTSATQAELSTVGTDGVSVVLA